MRIFFFIFLNNALGLFPYIFTASTHLVFGLSLGLPLWIGHFMLSYFNQPIFILAHLVPKGSPKALQPFIVLIEIIRNIIRPITLRVRLTANIIAGHLLLTLLGTLTNSNYLVLAFVLLGMIIIVLLETGVSLIQSYVYTVLSTLYISEVNSLSLNKFILNI